MQVSYPNEVKIYNLSSGKSLPEWLSDRKRRRLQQNDVDVQRRIELIQDFEMPDVSTNIAVSANDQYILATGTYKPRLRCYDVADLSMKFERCLDAEVIKMLVLTEGYEKVLFLEDDRWLELHSQNGHYFRTRMPRFGRDMLYVPSTCDVCVVGASSHVYRLNLELGRFLMPMKTDSTEINACALNPQHYLMAFGSNDGNVEAWDPRSKERAGRLNCKSAELQASCAKAIDDLNISRVEFKDALHMAVGLKSGQVLMFDIRGKSPLLVKDHYYGMPIKSISFSEEYVFSLDARCLKIWHQSDGKPFTTIELAGGVALNDHCLVHDSGLMFLAAETQKMQTYYIPSLGPAPKWCSFLDTITEELEESGEMSIYDDYKFLTVQELGNLGLDHLVGTNALRAYMHGYFIDVRLYQKALLLADPFAYEKYRKKKIRDKVQEERTSRIGKEKAKEKADANAKAQLKLDPRWNAMFDNPDFEVDETSEAYMLRKPAQAKAIAKAAKKKDKAQSDIDGREPEDPNTVVEDGTTVGKRRKPTKKPKQVELAEPDKTVKTQTRNIKVFELETGDSFKGFSNELLTPEAVRSMEKLKNASLAERLEGSAVHTAKKQQRTWQGKSAVFQTKRPVKKA